MADDSVSNIYGGLNFVPADTTWGTGAQIIGQALPSLVNPYASPMQNLGVTLGGALVASLLGYQGRKEAFDMSLQTQQYANQMQALQSAQERTAFLGALPSDVQSSRVGSKLSALSQALMQQEARVQSVIDAKLAEQEAKAKFELGETGTKLFERDISKAIRIALAQRGGSTINKDVAREDQKILRYAQSAEAIAKEFDKLNMSAAEFEIQRRIPGSKAEIVYSNLLGNLTNFARLGGQGAQVSDQDRDDQFNSLFGPELPGFGRISGTDSIAKRIREKIKAAPLSTGSLGSTMETSITTAGESPAQTRNKQLKAEKAQLEALIAQRK